MFKLKTAAQVAKHTLSTQQTASVQIESLHEGMDFQCTVTRCVHLHTSLHDNSLQLANTMIIHYTISQR